MGSQPSLNRQYSDLADSSSLLSHQSQIDKIESIIIESCQSYEFSQDEISFVPRDVIDLILQYSEHWKWTEFKPIWAQKDIKKSDYFRIYDIHLKQLRLELLDKKGNTKSQSALKKTHFNRFEYALNQDRRKISFTINFFRYAPCLIGSGTTLIQGCVRIGFASNMYHKNSAKKIYKECVNSNNNATGGNGNKFDSFLSNGECFVGLCSHVVFDENTVGLYAYDTNNKKAYLYEKEAPFEWGEHIEVSVDLSECKVTFRRLMVFDSDGEPKKYQLFFPPNKRFDNEAWYPCLSINMYKADFLQIGCQLIKGMML